MTCHPNRRAIACVVTALFVPLVEAVPADDLRKLVESGRAAEALAQGLNHQREWGKPDFDYWFGLAAIDAGAPGQGVLALERFLLANPASLSGQLELARGYFLLGDLVRSRELFEGIAKQNPPANVRQRIDQYRAAIDERTAGARTRFNAFVELVGGHDSNVNGGLAQSEISLPLFGTFTLAPESRERKDRFAALSGGLSLTVPLSRESSLVAGLNADTRQHADANAFDQGNAGGFAGFAWQRGTDQWRASVSGGRFTLDGDRYRSSAAGTLEWNRKLDSARMLGLFAQVARLSYAGDNRVRDAQFSALGANWSQRLGGAWDSVAMISAYLGRETNRRDRDDLTRNVAGIKAGLGLTLSPTWNAALGTTYVDSRYDQFDPFLGATRRDRYAGFDAALGYTFSKNLGLRLEWTRVDNRSNVALFEYDRNAVAAKLRYEFK